ncbi:MAG: tetratricopeptide repeat protein [Ferruginibacter sp.]
MKRLLLVVICNVFISLAHAQTGERGLAIKKDSAAKAGNTYAIIIGISQYEVVPALQYADKDAQAFEDFLMSEGGGKVPKAHIETFLNERAIKNNVADAIAIVNSKAQPGDRVYFFFAGHGDMEDIKQVENGLLLLYKSPNGNYFGMKDDVLEIYDLKKYLSPLALRGVEMIFIVDACHSGNLGGGIEGVQQTAAALAASWGKEYKILSCQPNQLSLESKEYGGGRGLFSLQLEEGMKGLADKNNDGKVSFSELQRYITDQVASLSEERQIPVLTGDLGKSFVNVNQGVLAALKKRKAEDYPVMAVPVTKGSDDKYVDSLDAAGKKIYKSFKQNIEDKKLIWPPDTNALKDYRAFTKKYSNTPLATGMRRSLATALNVRFNDIAGPLLKGETSYSTRDECYYAAAELDSCLNLLGEQHYLYLNLKARKLYMKAMALTWALSEDEYNISWKPTILESLKLLEESAALEPNAAYTFQGLGINYNFIYEYDKANAAFQKYLALRPNDLYARYSLGLIYNRLKQFDKAEKIFEPLSKDYPADVNIKLQLSEIYWNNDKADKAMQIINTLIASDNDKLSGYFAKGVYYARISKPDSAIYYYNETKKYYPGYCSICDNNIGHMYFVNNRDDSARKYFNIVTATDSTYAHAHFNLGVIAAKEGDLAGAIDQFSLCILNASTTLEGFITNMQLYFGKTYSAKDEKGYAAFKKKVYQVNMQYVSYVSMLYTYIRVPGFIDSTENINEVFDRMFNYKPEDVWTWYHHACWKALQKNKAAALESLEKSLKLGFGDYFMLVSDNDLSFIRETNEFKVLLERYFPDKGKKKS